MSKFRKPFLSELKKHWLQRFPLWRPGACTPVFWARKDSTYTMDSTLASKGTAFHAVITFSTKWPGAFTCDVIVTPDLHSSGDTLPIRMPADVATLPPGTYRIGRFMGGKDIWWRLVDDAEESRKFYAQIPNLKMAPPVIARDPNHWYADSYGDLDAVIKQAAHHFCDTFEQHVVSRVSGGS